MGLANKITIIRILLVPFLLTCLFYYDSAHDFLRFFALAIFFVCGLTDAIDGYIARRYYQKTKLGSILDPLADKLLILTAFLSLSVLNNIPQPSRIPAWLTIIVISRDFIILLGTMLIFMIHKDIEIKPSFFGKTTTFFQMIAILGSLLQIRPVEILWWLTAFFTIVSGLGYTWRGTKLLNESH